MPYIDTTPRDYPIKFEEGNLQDMFGQLLTDNGWVLVRTFYKAAVDTRAYFQITNRVNYAIAKHSIFKNADGKLLGMATVGNFSLWFKFENRVPIRRPYDEKDPNDPNFRMTPSWEDWVRQRYADTVSSTSLYFYMLEKLPNSSLAPNDGIVSIVTMPGMSGTSYNITRDRDRRNWHEWYYYGIVPRISINEGYTQEMDFINGKILSASPFHVIRSALDIEVLETEWSQDNNEAYITKTDPRVMQSPIVKSTLRAEFLEKVDDPIWHTNWWTDSEVSIKGHVDSNTIFLIMQADNAPVWEKNLVPTIPLYFGKILSLDGDKDEGYALFSGTMPPYKRANISNDVVVSLFDFDDPGATVGETMLPLLKLYPHHPANGVDSVIVSRSRFGARYQAHYLSWGAPSNQLPPAKITGDGRKYPRAYESYENTNNYKYQFNPSRYSGKIHSSRIFVIHPEEGVRGYLDKSIGFNTQSINTSNLRVRKADCPEKVYEMYKYLSIGAVSPLTKLPATPFRPIGVGIYSHDYNPNAAPYDPTNDATPPGEVTITKVTSPQTQTIDVEFTLPTDPDFRHVNIYVDGHLYAKGVTGTNFYRITGLKIGFKPEIKITTVDLAGNESVGVIAPTVTVA